jgi:DNA-binding transcriptional LysR family regulator
MARAPVNRSGEMEMFVRVVEHGAFSAAARSLRMTPSALSKLVARLERRLGVRLVNRSTRNVQLTTEGAAFYERSVKVLAEIDEAERSAATSAAPRGRVRINANVPFGLNYLFPLLPSFLALHPEITLDIVLTDQVIDLLEQRADLAIRVGPLLASLLTLRKLGESPMRVVAAPDYLVRCGTPRDLEELERHNRIGYCFARVFDAWPFRTPAGASATLPVVGNAQVSDGESLRRLALAGAGIARLSLFLIAPDIRAGRLVPVLEDFNPGDTEEINALFLGQGGHLPSRVRAVIEFLAETVPRRLNETILL